MMNRSCGATLSLCNFAVYLVALELRRRAFFPPVFFYSGRHACRLRLLPQDPNEESSPRQDPPGSQPI